MAEYAIETSGLSKSYGRVKAVDSIDFAVDKGELFGIIGPDGSGKTTLFRMLTTLIDPDSGSARVDGMDIISDYRKIRAAVGYVPGRFSLYQDLTVRENLEFFASVFGTTIEENNHLIRDIYCRLEPFSDRKAGNLSGGMKQKLALCCALIHAPSVLFLDEPTTGVDASSRREFWEMLSKLKSEFGISMLVSTAYMDEVTKCDKIAMMNKGKFFQTGTASEIIGNFGRPLLSVRASNMYKLLSDIRSNAEIDACYTFGMEHHVRLKKGSYLKPSELKSFLEAKGCEDVEVNYCSPTMEDCFLLESSITDGECY